MQTITEQLNKAWNACDIQREENALLKAVKDIHEQELDAGVGVEFRIQLRDFLLDYIKN